MKGNTMSFIQYEETFTIDKTAGTTTVSESPLQITGGGGLQITGGVTYLLGSDNDNVIKADNGSEIILGYGGNDTLYGFEGNDLLYGDIGNDIINGNLDNDYISGGAGVDRLFGGKGSDYVIGDDDNDTVNGNIGTDTVYGGAGDDIVYGGRDNDILFGDAGNDRLNGDLGDDELSGDAGQDTFVINLYGGHDTITGFEGAGDGAGDIIEVAANVASSIDAILSQITYSGGNAEINFSATQTLTVLGVASGSLTSADFHIA